MKKLFLIVMIAAGHGGIAQDIFQQNLYSPELVLKYREEAGLTAEQVEKIKRIYNEDLPAYNNKKWDLDAAMAKLEQMIAQSPVDAKAADAQLEKSLALETQIKKMKLATLLKIKNTLTLTQQAKLDPFKNEPATENSITASLNDNQRVIVKIRPGTESTAKPLYIIQDGNEKKIVDGLPQINPADIERMEVLKGGDATAAYGKKGENGVIIITMKKK